MDVHFLDGSVWGKDEITQAIGSGLSQIITTPDEANSASSALIVQALDSYSSSPLDKAVMDLAVADLNLTSGNGEQVGEYLRYASGFESTGGFLAVSADDSNVLEKVKKSA